MCVLVCGRGRVLTHVIAGVIRTFPHALQSPLDRLLLVLELFTTRPPALLSIPWLT